MSEELSPSFLDAIRNELEGLRAEIINKSHVSRADLRDRDREPRDSIDESTDEQDTSTHLRLKDRERNLLAQINEALMRIDSDDYGYCENCGEFIGQGRLKARPMATLCIDCKQAEEDEERRRNAVNPGLFTDLE
jgi:DnaK suppressor protein